MKWFVQLHKLFPLSTHSYMQCFTGGAEAKVILDDNMMVYSKNRCILLLYDSPGMTCAPAIALPGVIFLRNCLLLYCSFSHLLETIELKPSAVIC
jgi:hypothetical protein